MSRFCGGDVNFTGGFDELISALEDRRKLFLHWKWLYGQLQFWKHEIESSRLFDDNEINILLPNIIPYLSQIFNISDTDDHTQFLKCICKDTKWRYKLYQELGWNCLLIEHEKSTHFCEEDEVREESEVSLEACSTNTNLSLGMTCSENFKSFFIKLNYLLDLFLPNNFQHSLYRYAFGANGSEFNDYEIMYPFPLIFSKKYYAMVEIMEANLKKSKQDNKKPKDDNSKKKEKKLNLPVSPLANKPEGEQVNIENTILPLKMAYEINDDFWKAIEKKVLDENPPVPTKEKNKPEEKEKTQDKAEVTEKDKKKEKKKGKK